MKPEPLLDTVCTLGESPCWNASTGELYWVDGPGHTLHVFSPDSRDKRVIDVGMHVGCVALRQDGGILATMERGVFRLELTDGSRELIAEPERLPDYRLNDGKCDCRGRFWVGSMARKGVQHVGTPAGSLYCIQTDGSWRKVVTELGVSNGMAWGPDDRTFYHVDSFTRQVSAFDFRVEDGSLTHRRVVIRTPAEMGFPDGMAADAEGMLWIAQWGGSRVCRWDPTTGRLLQTVPLPVANVTSCAFGGRDLDELFITTARPDSADRTPQPGAGALFHIRPGVKGLRAYRFADRQTSTG